MKVDWDDILIAADATGRGEQATFHHRNIREVISVTQDPIMRKVLEGMDSKVYGNVNILILDTLAEALAHVRKRR